MRNRSVWLACFAGLPAILLGIVFLVLLAGNASTPGSDVYEYWGASAVMAILFPLVGAVIIARVPGHALGWLFCIIGWFTAAGDGAAEYAKLALADGSGSLPGATAAAWAGSYLADVGFFSFPLVLLLFPDGRAPTRRWRPLVQVAIGAVAALTLSSSFMPGPLPSFPSVRNPAGAEGTAAVLRAMQSVAFPVLTVSLFAGIASLVVRYRRSSGVERQQLKWFTYAASFVPVSLLLNTAFPDQAWWIGGVSLALMPIAIGIAILRYRLYDIDLIGNRTLVYGALSACIIGLYVLVVGYLGVLFPADDLLVSLIGAGFVAVLFEPLRSRLQRGVDRLMYGERDDPYAVVTRLGQRLEGVLRPSSVLPMVVDTVRDALKLPYVAISLCHGNDRELSAATGTPAGELLHIELIHQQRKVGELHVAPRSRDEPFGAADLRLLNDMARHIGVAAHAASLTTELQRSRERLVTAREEERRRLRRDLHDGLGPQLASQSLRLEAARDLLYTQPARAHALLEGLVDQSQALIGDIRRLVYALRPPALDQLGLLSAVREHVSHAAPSDLRVEVQLPGSIPALPAAVEVATYRIFQEAFTNVVRHASARTCSVRLEIDGDDTSWMLRLMVRDDGVGLMTAATGGIGLSTMRERAEELGGTFTVQRAEPSGTCVLATLPCGVQETYGEH